MSRRSFYFDKVKPNLRRIEEWLTEGITVRKICHDLEVPFSSWYEYAIKYQEFADVINRSSNNKIKAGELTEDIIENATFTLTVLVQHDWQGLDEEDEWVLTIRKYDNLRNRTNTGEHSE